MGRYPKFGWLTYESHTKNSSIVDYQLKGFPDWTGAEVVIRKSRYLIDRHIISRHSGSTINYLSKIDAMGNNGAMPTKLNGYFLQGHIATLSILINKSVSIGDWYYNPSNNKFYMYFGSLRPDKYSVKATNTNITTNLQSKTYLTFNNIDFEGGNKYTTYMTNSCSDITYKNCTWRNSGGFAFLMEKSNFISFTNCSIKNSSGNGGHLLSNDCTINGMTVDHVGMLAGMGNNGDGNSNGLVISGNNNSVSNIRITNTGYNGLQFAGSRFTLKNFFIDSFCVIKDDGGGLYCYNDASPNKVIENGIILNGQNALEGGRGDVSELYGKAHGVYLDDLSANITLDNVYIANCSRSGIFIHCAHDISILNCLSFNNDIQIYFEEYKPGLIYNIAGTGNKFIAKTENQLTAFYHCYGRTNFSNYGKSDNNVYARPISEGATIRTLLDGVSSQKNISLTAWINNYGQDANSTRSLTTTKNLSDFKFNYNPLASPLVLSLGAPYKDVKNKNYNGRVVISPYQAVVLIKVTQVNRAKEN
jgi:hypothetical protein